MIKNPLYYYREEVGGLMVSVLVSGSSGPSSIPDLGHCVVFLGKTLYSHSASLHLGVEMGTGELYARGSTATDQHPNPGEKEKLTGT